MMSSSQRNKHNAITKRGGARRKAEKANSNTQVPSTTRAERAARRNQMQIEREEDARRDFLLPSPPNRRVNKVRPIAAHRIPPLRRVSLRVQTASGERTTIAVASPQELADSINTYAKKHGYFPRFYEYFDVAVPRGEVTVEEIEDNIVGDKRRDAYVAQARKDKAEAEERAREEEERVREGEERAREEELVQSLEKAAHESPLRDYPGLRLYYDDLRKNIDEWEFKPVRNDGKISFMDTACQAITDAFNSVREATERDEEYRITPEEMQGLLYDRAFKDDLIRTDAFQVYLNNQTPEVRSKLWQKDEMTDEHLLAMLNMKLAADNYKENYQLGVIVLRSLTQVERAYVKTPSNSTKQGTIMWVVDAKKVYEGAPSCEAIGRWEALGDLFATTSRPDRLRDPLWFRMFKSRELNPNGTYLSELDEEIRIEKQLYQRLREEAEAGTWSRQLRYIEPGPITKEKEMLNKLSMVRGVEGYLDQLYEAISIRRFTPINDHDNTASSSFQALAAGLNSRRLANGDQRDAVSWRDMQNTMFEEGTFKTSQHFSDYLGQFEDGSMRLESLMSTHCINADHLTATLHIHNDNCKEERFRLGIIALNNENQIAAVGIKSGDAYTEDTPIVWVIRKRGLPDSGSRYCWEALGIPNLASVDGPQNQLQRHSEWFQNLQIALTQHSSSATRRYESVAGSSNSNHKRNMDVAASSASQKRLRINYTHGQSADDTGEQQDAEKASELHGLESPRTGRMRGSARPPEPPKDSQQPVTEHPCICVSPKRKAPGDDEEESLSRKRSRVSLSPSPSLSEVELEDMLAESLPEKQAHVSALLARLNKILQGSPASLLAAKATQDPPVQEKSTAQATQHPEAQSSSQVSTSKRKAEFSHGDEQQIAPASKRQRSSEAQEVLTPSLSGFSGSPLCQPSKLAVHQPPTGNPGNQEDAMSYRSQHEASSSPPSSPHSSSTARPLMPSQGARSESPAPQNPLSQERPRGRVASQSLRHTSHGTAQATQAAAASRTPRASEPAASQPPAQAPQGAAPEQPSQAAWGSSTAFLDKYQRWRSP